MNPIKYKKVVAAASKELGLSEELVDEVVDYYYKVVHKKLASLEHYNIRLIGLGTFSLRRMKLENKITHYERALANLEKEEDMSMRKYGSISRIKTELESFHKVLKLHDGELQHKLQKKEEKRKFNSENNELDKSMEI